MSYVKNAVVTSTATCDGIDGATWKSVIISSEDTNYKPGQFLMVSPSAGTVAGWPSPLMIQRSFTQGFEVIVHPDSPLFSLQIGAPLVIWGPNGKAPAIEGKFSVISDAKGLILGGPIIHAWKNRCSAVYMVGSYCEEAAISFLKGVPVKKADLKTGVKKEDEELLVILPLEEFAKWKQAYPEILDNSIAFIGAKIGCGIGACRGCFIHSGPKSTGMAVCQEGPFMRVGEIDYTKDQNFLGHYI